MTKKCMKEVDGSIAVAVAASAVASDSFFLLFVFF